MKVYRLNDSNGTGGFIVSKPEDLVEELKTLEERDSYYLFIEDIDEIKFNSLPEWDGF